MIKNTNLGVALTNCFFCGEPDRIIMNSTLTKKSASKIENMRGCVIDMEPCQKCREYMEKGIILITIDPDKSKNGWERASIPNPYRTGGFFVVKEEALDKLMPGDAVDFAKKHRWMFVAHKAAVLAGLFDAHEKFKENAK